MLTSYLAEASPTSEVSSLGSRELCRSLSATNLEPHCGETSWAPRHWFVFEPREHALLSPVGVDAVKYMNGRLKGPSGGWSD